MCVACDVGLLASDDIRTGWLRDASRKAVQVRYANVDGLAVFEGCILLGRTDDMEQTRLLVEQNPGILDPENQELGHVIKGIGFRWPNGEIPFVMDDSLSALERKNVMLDAIAHWHSHTPVRLRPLKQDDDSWVRFRNGDGCAAHVGRQGGEQEVVLGPGCTVGNAIHEIGHAFGLWHEQGRSDRDQFVEIIFSNIAENVRHNFEHQIDTGLPVASYDYDSIMHYGANAFAIDPSKPTIRVKQPGRRIGQRNGLSAGDIATVKAMLA